MSECLVFEVFLWTKLNTACNRAGYSKAIIIIIIILSLELKCLLNEIYRKGMYFNLFDAQIHSRGHKALNPDFERDLHRDDCR